MSFLHNFKVFRCLWGGKWVRHAKTGQWYPTRGVCGEDTLSDYVHVGDTMAHYTNNGFDKREIYG